MLIRLSIPANPADAGAWLADRAGTVSLALGLLPFAGIAFLWFIGVVRDRLGPLEDQFFATVFFGSGLLFLALAFVSAALAGGILATYALETRRFIDSGMYTLTRAVLYRITNVYAVKMAGVFMISLATIWVRTRLMPRWLALLTYVLALGLLLSITSSLGHVDFSGMGRRSQRIHPRHESAQPIVNADSMRTFAHSIAFSGNALNPTR